MRPKYLIDLHTHTVASGHAYSSLKENTDYAQSIGLALLGLSDHAPEMPHSTQEYFFLNSKILPRRFGELDFLFGVELNIMDKDGTIDLKPYILKRLDYAIASLHPPCIAPSTEEENTAAILNAIKNPYVNIIGHPCDPRYPIDIHSVVTAARDNNVLLEINNASYNPNNGRHGGEAMTLELLAECKKQAMPVILGSDAHFHMLIGDFSYAEPLLEEADFPDELIVNTDPAFALEFFKKQEPENE
ncbi:MAG: phosphatase [Firmicutes bacterium]|nr:phosphatase [Bacillota bacterium]MBQ9605330.1 phosphatase [Bacillota bacterium]